MVILRYLMGRGVISINEVRIFRMGRVVSLNARLQIKLWVYELLMTEESFDPFCKTGYEKLERGMNTTCIAYDGIPNSNRGTTISVKWDTLNSGKK